MNGDGFGIGWYSNDLGEGKKKEKERVKVKGWEGEKEEGRQIEEGSPCVFTSITPAWNNINLQRLAEKIVSKLIFAHVRAASPGLLANESNCHPFQYSPSFSSFLSLNSLFYGKKKVQTVYVHAQWRDCPVHQNKEKTFE